MSNPSKWLNRKHRRRLSIRRSGARNILFGRFGTDERKRETSRRESETESIFFVKLYFVCVLKVDKKTSTVYIRGGGVLGRLEVEKNIFCSCWVFAFKLWWCPAMMNLGFQYLHVFTYRYPPNFPNVDRYAMHLSGPGCYWNKIITIILLRWRLISLLFVVVLTIYLRCKFPKKTMQN